MTLTDGAIEAWKGHILNHLPIHVRDTGEQKVEVMCVGSSVRPDLGGCARAGVRL